MIIWGLRNIYWTWNAPFIGTVSIFKCFVILVYFDVAMCVFLHVFLIFEMFLCSWKDVLHTPRNNPFLQFWNYKCQNTSKYCCHFTRWFGIQWCILATDCWGRIWSKAFLFFLSNQNITGYLSTDCIFI